MTYLPAHTYGSSALARMRHRALVERLGEQHPAAQAALGRYWAVSGSAVPQRGLVSPAAVAWTRESGAIPGWMNQRERYELTLRRGQAVTIVGA